METLEMKGKSVDEAIFAGLAQMGLSIDEVDIEILHEGNKGLFGIGKNACVILKKKEKIVSAPEQFLNEVFSLMGISANCITLEDKEAYKLNVEGEDTAVIIGRRGDTLDALQYLTSLVVNKGKEDYKRVSLDAENYRSRREQTLEKLAKRLASTVAKTGKPIALEPMNPYERRVIHAALQQNPRVDTYSEGEEPFRHLVIKRADKKEQ